MDGAFQVDCVLFCCSLALQIIAVSVGPKMMEDEFEPPVAGLFLLVNFWVV